jgi:hypothetical protein
MKKILLILVLISSFILLACSENGGEEEGFSDTSIGGMENPQNIGEKIKVGDLEWMVLEIKNEGSFIASSYRNREDCISESGTFLKVKTQIENMGTEPKRINQPTLIDSNGNAFETNRNISHCVKTLGEEVFYSEVNPNLIYTFSTIYEIPKDLDLFEGQSRQRIFCILNTYI